MYEGRQGLSCKGRLRSAIWWGFSIVLPLRARNYGAETLNAGIPRYWHQFCVFKCTYIPA